MNDDLLAAVSHETKIFTPKILWNKLRDKEIIKAGGIQRYNRLPPSIKIEKILREVFRNCHISDPTKLAMARDLEKRSKKFSWIDSLKRPVEEGGKAVLVTLKSSSRRAPPLEQVIHHPEEIYDDSKILEKYAKFLGGMFSVKRSPGGEAKGIEYVNLKSEVNNLNSILRKLNVNDPKYELDINLLIRKLRDLSFAESIPFDKTQLEALIKAFSNQYSDTSEKYMLLKNLRRVYKSGRGDTDPDYDPKTVGMIVTKWRPVLTREGKDKSFVSEEVLSTVRTGAYVYVRAEEITLRGKRFLIVKRFDKFSDYLMSLRKTYANPRSRRYDSKKVKDIDAYLNQ